MEPPQCRAIVLTLEGKYCTTFLPRNHGFHVRAMIQCQQITHVMSILRRSVDVPRHPTIANLDGYNRDPLVIADLVTVLQTVIKGLVTESIQFPRNPDPRPASIVPGICHRVRHSRINRPSAETIRTAGDMILTRTLYLTH